MVLLWVSKFNINYLQQNLKQHFAEDTWLFYPLVASSSLLLAYLAFLVINWGYSKSKRVQGWMRRLTGKPPKEEKMLLHTLPYYLAITRSSCEVSWVIIFLDSTQSSQAYVLNLPIGHKASNVARDAVKLGDYKWKLNAVNKGRWKTWVSLLNCVQQPTWFPFSQLKRAIPAALIMLTVAFLAAFLTQAAGGDSGVDLLVWFPD